MSERPSLLRRVRDNFKEARKGPIAALAGNHVAANCLMAVLILGGVLFALSVKQEVFPEFSTDRVSISVVYPGASPAEVEQGVILAIEEKVEGIDGVKEVTGRASEGRASVAVELLTSADPQETLQEVNNAVSSILSFPDEAEEPVISLAKVRNKVITVLVHGKASPAELRVAAERLRDQLRNHDGISLVELSAAPPLEIAIEVPLEELRRHDLTLGRVAAVVRDTSVELGGGAVRAEGGEILLRTNERRLVGEDFHDIPVLSRPDGSVLRLGEIAHIRDTFAETDEEDGFNGDPAYSLGVFRVGNQTPQEVVAATREVVADALGHLPPGLDIDLWEDNSKVYQQRIDLLLRNMALGLILVLILLGLFLEPRLAFWVTVGIPVSVLGAFLFFPLTGASINMISLFAFIVTLGIIVDDAIVVGENIYEKRQQGMKALDAAIAGAREIAGPVLFAVLTNIAAFLPMFFVPGQSGKLFLQIPAVTVIVFCISLVESLFILPAHLAKAPRDGALWRVLNIPRRHFSRGLDWVIQKTYVPSVRFATHWSFLTTAVAAAILFLAVGFVGGGHIPFTFMPRIDLDVVTAQAALPFGSPITSAREVQARLVAAVRETEKAVGEEGIVTGILTRIGSPIPAGGPGAQGQIAAAGAHHVGVQIELVGPDERTISGSDFARRWREAAGAFAGLESITFSADLQSASGAAIQVELGHPRREVLETAAADLADRLAEYVGTVDINDGVNQGKPQRAFTLTPTARAFGVQSRDLALAVRHAFYGAEALRQQRGRNEVKVMVRLPEAERENLHTLESLVLRTPEGGELPFLDAVAIEEGRAYTQIERRDGRRVVSVTADVDLQAGGPPSGEIMRQLTAPGADLDQLIRSYPGLTWSVQGEQKDRAETFGALGAGYLLAILVIYALLAIPLRTYLQPLIIITSIPFGMVGAILGHLLLGYNLSLISMFGIIALSGVVVNDSLVLLVTANALRREEGLSAPEAIVRAAERRFRPIILTSLTTFFGLAPMIFETELQARFLIPMAISLGFGILFATFIILMVVPALYVIHDAAVRRARALWLGDAALAEADGGDH